MAHIQTESEWQEEMSAKIVEFVRHELYMELRYLKLALSQLQLKSDPDLRAFATDGACILQYRSTSTTETHHDGRTC